MGEVITYFSLKETKTEEPLSFDLSFEKKRIDRAKKEGKEGAWRTYNGFLNNAEFWSREYIAQMPTVHYLWNIKHDGEGNVRLHDSSFGYADEISKEAAEGEKSQNLPGFEKVRRKVEHAMTFKMYDSIKDSKVGDTFIWSSPPPEGVENESYGGYTMTHVYEIDQLENGERVLKGRDILHYASNEKQKEVLESISRDELHLSESPQAIELLGTLVKAKNNTTFSEIHSLLRDGTNIESLSEQDQKLEKFNKILDKNRGKLREVYQYLYLGHSNLAIESFKNWVDSVEEEWQGEQQRTTKQDAQARYCEYDLTQTDKDQYNFYQGIPPQMLSVQARMQIVSQPSNVMMRGGSCGKGFGMSGVGGNQNGPIQIGSIQQQQQAFGYAPVIIAGSLAGNRAIEQGSDYLNDPDLCKCGGEKAHFHCPGKVKTEAGEESCPYKVIVGKGITKCPKCGEGKRC